MRVVTCARLVDLCDVLKTHSMAWLLYHQGLPECRAPRGARQVPMPLCIRWMPGISNACDTSAFPEPGAVAVERGRFFTWWRPLPPGKGQGVQRFMFVCQEVP